LSFAVFDGAERFLFVVVFAFFLVFWADEENVM
jgi:hypothetical protein